MSHIPRNPNRPTPLSIQTLKKYAESQNNMPVRLSLARFISSELPLRFAATTSVLSSLPCQLSEMPATNDLISLYNRCQADIQNMEIPKTIMEDTEFTARLARVQRDLQHVYPLMACGVCQLKQMREEKKSPITDFENEMINVCLNDFVSFHISIIMLLGQYAKSLARPGGRIQTLDYSTIQKAIDRSSKLTDKFYGKAPSVNVFFANKLRPFDYIPSHIHHMIFEVMKNSMRATMENMKALGETDPEPINVIISHGDNDISIKISDMGGGIPRCEMSKVWNYTYTTAAAPSWVNRYFHYYEKTEHDLYLNSHIKNHYEFMGDGKEDKYYTHSATQAIKNNKIDSDSGHIDDLLSYSPVMRDHYAGLGYGLPISRMYSRYFGGDMKLFSMEGYGTDVYLYLSSLSDELEQFSTVV